MGSMTLFDSALFPVAAPCETAGRSDSCRLFEKKKLSAIRSAAEVIRCERFPCLTRPLF